MLIQTDSPYKMRTDEIAHLQVDAGDYFLWHMTRDILEMTDALDENEVGDVDELTKEQAEDAYARCTKEEVDKYVNYLLVPSAFGTACDGFRNKLMFADGRNSPTDDYIMLNTYSSSCMYPVIYEHLAKAARDIRKAVKAATTSPNTAGIAKDAFQSAFGFVLVLHEFDHWRIDSDSEEDLEEIAKKVSELLSNLLWFTDAELGLIDPYSRLSVVRKVDEIEVDWDAFDELGGMKAKTSINDNGMGRPL